MEGVCVGGERTGASRIFWEGKEKTGRSPFRQQSHSNFWLFRILDASMSKGCYEDFARACILESRVGFQSREKIL